MQWRINDNCNCMSQEDKRYKKKSLKKKFEEKKEKSYGGRSRIKKKS